MRGYDKWSKIGRPTKMNAVLQYFSKLRTKIQVQSQIKISKAYRAYKKCEDMRKQKMLEKKLKENENYAR